MVRCTVTSNPHRKNALGNPPEAVASSLFAVVVTVLSPSPQVLTAETGKPFFSLFLMTPPPGKRVLNLHSPNSLSSTHFSPAQARTLGRANIVTASIL